MEIIVAIFLCKYIRSRRWFLITCLPSNAINAIDICYEALVLGFEPHAGRSFECTVAATVLREVRASPVSLS